MDGEKSHWLVQTTLESLARLTHRGAVAADGKSGDGCGIMLQFPEPFLRDIAEECKFKLSERFASGLVFFSPEKELIERGQKILTRHLGQFALDIAGWRKVPTCPEVVGEQALESMPAIYQVFVNAPAGWRPHDIERQLYAARRLAYEEERELPEPDPLYYVVTLSNLTMVYKGLVQAEHLADFYPDLRDERMTSSIGICHQRFSTNTLPRWNYAQPFRYLAHNGEINSVNANRDWANARAGILHSPLLPSLESLSHLVNHEGSDSSSMDNLLEVFLGGGMDMFRAMRLLLPPAIRDDMDSELKAFLEFNSMHQEPWDGPAGVVSTNGSIACCNLDRNGLRPARYSITHDGVFTVASETGVWDCPPERIKRRGRLGPGEMIAVDTKSGKFWKNNAIDDSLKATHSYREWMTENVVRVWNNDDQERKAANKFMRESAGQLPIHQKMFGLGAEEIETIISPMALESQEPVGSMGDDTPVAVLSERNRSIYDYFRQSFAQVTNPPIDPLRESAVMSLETCIGREHNVFHETASHAYRVLLPWPVLNYVKYQTLLGLDQRYYRNVRFSLNYDPDQAGLGDSLKALAASSVQAVQGGATILVLSDRDISRDRLPIPAPLAVGAVHQALLRASERPNANIIIETGSARDPHQYAVLLGMGATAIYPYLAFQSINQQQESGALEGDPIQLRKNYRRGIRKGLLKILSKMGICTMASYRGSQLFEAVGLAPEVIELCCPKVASKIHGAGFAELENDARKAAGRAWADQVRPTRDGIYRYMHGGEQHAYNPDVVMLLQQAVASGQWSDYRRFADQVNLRPILAIRDLLSLRASAEPLPLSKVEMEEHLYPRFDTAAMSIGALSPEAHESLAIAMNRLGGRSNSGEGGEDPVRFSSDKNSGIKQVASGRFGVSAHYLVNADVLQIKVAQGAKPGEGGQLPGHKVTVEIAALRCSTPGVTLISPPPHHDIYSIEDLSQLIFDLKMVNPRALVSVKLVAGSGVGTIAVGVAKAYADLITIAGFDGGTGASPLSSVKYAGLPWELGLAETHQALVENGLRHKIRLQVDGGLKTGLDVVKAGILGAESFGFGTGPMVALGCKYLRICHLNNCATGIATQNEKLREQHFHGLPERVMKYFEFLARDVREILASLGLRNFAEVIGRSDLLEQLPGTTDKHRTLKLDAILASAGTRSHQKPYCTEARNPPFDAGLLNQEILEAARESLVSKEKWAGQFGIHNYDRSVGASLAGELARRHGREGLPDDSLKIKLTGTAGQSLGCWNTPGITIQLEGDANDYVGKGMSGGKIVLTTADVDRARARRNVICGNACLYGATGGELYANGQAGERFAVRNSGARAVIEGAGHHACEYMTGGTVVIMGSFGPNLAAGMTGGELFLLDPNRQVERNLNPEFVKATALEEQRFDAPRRRLKGMISTHVALTGSEWGRKVLDSWDLMLPHWVYIVPKKMLASNEISQQDVPLRLVKA
ncbi:MAG: glutamate synthase large subunit [Xanthomonadales bacterium]|nr:glutamate synthase large subunit [Gammaproteobacteria bacterium]MBT8052953.1 glutamate synthase large subunit [Gammaproteobacteria bacterium]NND57845.1 glutamate synthase large subunit [Xanthomonadales bacterium]NNK50725.1 glutamate synthase large subunit [Xanthomonadales bacterium]